MIVYRFVWVSPADPRSTMIAAGATIETATRELLSVQPWTVTTTGGEDSAAVIAALVATGYVIGTPTAEPA